MMFPILSENGSVLLSPQRQQQQQQRAFVSGNSVFIDPPTTFVQAQQPAPQHGHPHQPQKIQTMLSHPHGPQPSATPDGTSPFPSTHSSSIPVYTAVSMNASPFATRPSTTTQCSQAQTQRGTAINGFPQQQHIQPVFLQTTTPTTDSPFMSPLHQQHPQRGNNPAQYAALTHHTQLPVPSPTAPGSIHSQIPGFPQLFSTQPLTPLTSTPGGLQQSHGTAGHPHAASTASLVYSTPSSSVTQHPQQLMTGTTAGATDIMNRIAAATGGATTPMAANAAAVAPVSKGVVDAEEMRQANERPFRFRMLPPPPTFDRFLLQWEANAADAHYRPWRRSDANTPHGNNVERAGVLTEEDMLQRSAAASTAAVVASAGSGTNPGGPTPRSAEERLALAEQYHRTLERWWYYMAVFEQKPEVRQRLGGLHTCPDYADAQRAVASGFAELLPSELCEQLTPEEVTLQTWSHLVMKWWEETKRRRHTRRSRRGSRKEALSSSLTERSTLDRSQVIDGDATPPQMENDEETSVTSGNSFGMPSTEGSRHTHSLPDNEGYLNFDFTNQTTFGSPAESG
ncbi:hypothetical protein ABL78_2518 [Leptomonas seymouri]|uniref:Uncharacterized protein n=1 Tax=Leptomonas seymouri TaxID=5684 RepID=A0A0N0P755_LEPSE|nr:hypothetical protein ABL78_2518 [Leptomonas seymouri]|eukprot:KPI88399.1 hypothetical protein ABL78_2518 [Leptomonas seymouri]